MGFMFTECVREGRSYKWRAKKDKNPLPLYSTIMPLPLDRVLRQGYCLFTAFAMFNNPIYKLIADLSVTHYSGDLRRTGWRRGGMEGKVFSSISEGLSMDDDAC